MTYRQWGTRCLSFFLHAAASALLSATPSEAQRLSVVSVGANLGWMSYDLTSGQTTQVGAFGSAGDHLAPGAWLGTGGVQIAITTAQRDSGGVLWRVLGPSGSAIVEHSFGRVGETAVSAVDVDKSGIADPIMIGTQGKRLAWQIQYDLFRGGTKSQTFVHGFQGELPFFINPDGSGDLLATLEVAKNSSTVRLFNPRTGQRSVVRRLPKVPSGTQSPIPVPLTRPDGKQALLVSRTQGARTTLALYDLSTRTASTSLVDTVGDVIVGDLRSNPGHEVAVGRNGQAIVVNLFDGSREMVSVPNGVLVDGVNINVIGSEQREPPRQTPTPLPPTRATAVPQPQPTTGSAPPSSAGLRGVCATVSSIGPREMLIKSEPSNHIHGGDPRTTGYTVVCGTLCPKNLAYAQFFFADGTFAGAVAKYGLFSGNRRPRMYGAVSRAPQHFSSEIAAKAATIGNGKLYLQMSAATEGEATECKEFAPSGRNGSLH